MVSAPNIRLSRYQIMTLECLADCSDMSGWLTDQCSRAPALMREMAVVLKVTSNHSERSIKRCIEALEKHDIGLIGLTGDPNHRKIAGHLNLVWLTEKMSLADQDQQDARGLKLLDPMIVYGPVRSGMQIYAKDRDLIIIGQVSEGAEIMADGNVHVYGRLRGRVAIGVNGKAEAQLFSQQFEPQLVSIAGLYVRPDQIPNEFLSQSVQVRLDADVRKLQYSLL